MFLRWCVPTIVIMESDEDTRVVFIRVCDTCDNAVQQNKAIAINMSESLHCVFLSLDIEMTARLPSWFPTKRPHTGWLYGVFVGEWLFVFPLCGFSLSLFCNYPTQATEAVQIRHQPVLKPFNSVEADLTHAGVGESYVITLACRYESSSLSKTQNCCPSHLTGSTAGATDGEQQQQQE